MTKDYVTKADGWTAGKWRAKGDPLVLTEAQAKYENVTLASDAGPRVELTGSLDDPTVKSSGLALRAKTETEKRGRGKK